MAKKKQIVGFDGEVMHGATREDRVAQIKYYLEQWMNPNDAITWYTDAHGDDEGKPNCAVVITEYGEAADASAVIV